MYFSGCLIWGALFPLCSLAQDEAVTETSPSEEKDSKPTGIKGLFENSKDDKGAPLYVKSDSLRLNAKKRVFTYDGNVEIVRGDLRITCDSMIGTYDEDNQLKTVLCRGNVVITQGEDMRASSNRAMYTVKAAIIELTEGPELARGGNALSADKITMFVDEDRSEAEGNVRVKVIKTDEQTGVASSGGLGALRERKDERSDSDES